MSTSQLLYLILYGFWAPALTLAAAYGAWRYFTLRYERRREYDAVYRTRDELGYEIQQSHKDTGNRIQDLAERLEQQNSFSHEFLSKYLEDVRVSLAEQVRVLQENTLRLKGNETAPERMIAAKTVEETSSRTDPRSIQIVREISHALFTPLSRVEAVTENVLAMKLGENVSSKMALVKSAIEMCYVYLGAYRSMLNVSASASYWNPNDLRSAISSSMEVYSEAAKKDDLRISVMSPPAFEGLSNMYLLAVLMPLLENAVEASEDTDEISIQLFTLSDGLHIEIANPVHKNFPGDKVFEHGFSTKAERETHFDGDSGKHQGIGLSIVQNLMAAVPGATITCSSDQDAAHFSILFPKVR